MFYCEQQKRMRRGNGLDRKTLERVGLDPQNHVPAELEKLKMDVYIKLPEIIQLRIIQAYTSDPHKKLKRSKRPRHRGGLIFTLAS